MTSSGWALVTGASSGIGRELAFEYARHGHGVFLVGRDSQALASAEAECRALGSPATRIHVADLSVAAQVDGLVAEVREIPVEFLVHNAGFGVHGEFIRTSAIAEHRLVELQIQTTLTLTKALVPAMIARGRGTILNIASVYSVSPVPEQAVYGACKAFLLSFAEALATELTGTGVSVTTICPGITQTEFRKRSGIREKAKKGGFSGMSARKVAQVAYRESGRRKRVVVPGALNKVYMRVCRTLPMSWVSGAVRRVNRTRGLASANHLEGRKQ